MEQVPVEQIREREVEVKIPKEIDSFVDVWVTEHRLLPARSPSLSPLREGTVSERRQRRRIKRPRLPEHGKDRQLLDPSVSPESMYRAEEEKHPHSRTAEDKTSPAQVPVHRARSAEAPPIQLGLRMVDRSNNSGCLVTRVYPGLPAAAAGGSTCLSGSHVSVTGVRYKLGSLVFFSVDRLSPSRSGTWGRGPCRRWSQHSEYDGLGICVVHPVRETGYDPMHSHRFPR